MEYFFLILANSFLRTICKLMSFVCGNDILPVNGETGYLLQLAFAETAANNIIGPISRRKDHLRELFRFPIISALVIPITRIVARLSVTLPISGTLTAAELNYKESHKLTYRIHETKNFHWQKLKFLQNKKKIIKKCFMKLKISICNS